MKSKDKKESSNKIEQYKQAVKSRNMDDTLDIQKFLTDKKKKRRNVIELMRQEKQQKTDGKKKGRKDKKGKKRPSKHSRKMGKR